MSNHNNLSPAQLSKFGNALYSRRTFLGRSQYEIGKATGVTGATISRWELGRARPYGNHIAPLARALEWTTRELLSETDLDIKIGAAESTAHVVEEAATLEVSPVPAARYGWMLGNPHTESVTKIRGTDPNFKVTVYTPGVTDRDVVELAWMEALIHSAPNMFAVDMPAALVKLLEANPDWEVVDGWLTPIEPEL